LWIVPDSSGTGWPFIHSGYETRLYMETVSNEVKENKKTLESLKIESPAKDKF
jgi:hypothetical protein